MYEGTAEERAAVSAAFSAACDRHGVDEAGERLDAIAEEMRPIAEAINALPVSSIEGLRAKALVAFWEVAPVCASGAEYSFDDAIPFRELFCAVAELCGLTGKVAATGFLMPYMGYHPFAGNDDSDDEEEA